MTTKKRKPPARTRYEQNHPTISFRLDMETKERLKKALEGQSFADFIKEALGVKEKESKEEERKKAHDRGYTKGWNEAESKFGVIYNCSVCGKPITIVSKEAKQEAKKHMEQERWGHYDCLNR